MKDTLQTKSNFYLSEHTETKQFGRLDSRKLKRIEITSTLKFEAQTPRQDPNKIIEMIN